MPAVFMWHPRHAWPSHACIASCMFHATYCLMRAPPHAGDEVAAGVLLHQESGGHHLGQVRLGALRPSSAAWHCVALPAARLLTAWGCFVHLFHRFAREAAGLGGAAGATACIRRPKQRKADCPSL